MARHGQRGPRAGSPPVADQPPPVVEPAPPVAEQPEAPPTPVVEAPTVEAPAPAMPVETPAPPVADQPPPEAPALVRVKTLRTVLWQSMPYMAGETLTLPAAEAAKRIERGEVTPV